MDGQHVVVHVGNQALKLEHVMSLYQHHVVEVARVQKAKPGIVIGVVFMEMLRILVAVPVPVVMQTHGGAPAVKKVNEFPVNAKRWSNTVSILGLHL